MGSLCGRKTLIAGLNGNRELGFVDYGGWTYVGTERQCRSALEHDCLVNDEPFAHDCIGLADQDDILTAVETIDNERQRLGGGRTLAP